MIFSQPGNEWTECTLHDVTEKITDGKHGDCENEVDSGYFFLSAKNVKDGTLHYEKARQITRLDFEETHRRTNLEPGDILMTNAGTIGRMAVAPTDEKTRRTTFQKSVAIIKLKKELLDTHFAYYCLTAGLKRFVKMSAGAAQKNLLLRDIRSYRFMAPASIVAQRAVAAQIDELATLTARLEAIYQQKLAALAELKKSLLHQAFSGAL
jgi:type I restriction enzyme S subunit